MASVNYNYTDLDLRHNPTDVYYEPNIPFYTQMYTNNPQQYDRM